MAVLGWLKGRKESYTIVNDVTYQIILLNAAHIVRKNVVAGDLFIEARQVLRYINRV